PLMTMYSTTTPIMISMAPIAVMRSPLLSRRAGCQRRVTQHRAGRAGRPRHRRAYRLLEHHQQVREYPRIDEVDADDADDDQPARRHYSRLSARAVSAATRKSTSAPKIASHAISAP